MKTDHKLSGKIKTKVILFHFIQFWGMHANELKNNLASFSKKVEWGDAIWQRLLLLSLKNWLVIMESSSRMKATTS
ncbi:hypothetical protein CFP56_020622 [Quercus suber]|uniref:Uncharacterized protein n=1 Tax=Quercus suber TaxID=58331 RepID=A0AAW0KH74_QUESU